MRNQEYVATIAAKGNALRWAVGHPDNLRSATWRFWGNKKGDFYLSMQSTGGIVKASFHADGNCHIGHTSEHWKSKMLENAGRHWNKWNISNELDGRAIQILIPTSELRKFNAKQPKQVSWIPPAPANSMAVISIFISEKQRSEPWPAYSDGALPIGVMNTKYRTAWLVYMYQSIPDKFMIFVFDGRNIAASLPGADEILKTEEPRGCVCGNNASGENFMLEVASPGSGE